MNKIIHFTLSACLLLGLSSPLLSQQFIADYTVAKEEVFRNIPLEYINKVKTELVVAYQHTSHGTHVSRGMFGLSNYKPGDEIYQLSRDSVGDVLEFRDFAMEDYAPPGVEATDLSRDVETGFIQTTRNYLDAPENATVNVVMWAWSRIAGHDVAGNYLPGMDSLISEYGPGGSKIGSGAGQREVPVTFIYMTGHAIKNENTGPLNPLEQAQLIIDTSNARQMFCHDYYSIDTHTMDDVYYEDTGDNGDSDTYGGNFLQDWQDAHILGEHYYENWQTLEGYVAYGEHTTQHITSNRKAYAMWWILARIAGWDGVIPVGDIQIQSPGDTTSVMTGDTLALSAVVLPDVAGNKAVEWTVVSGTGSAGISAGGVLRGAMPGDVEVLATALDGSGVADTISLTILDPLVPVSGIAIRTEGDRLNMNAGTTMQCSADILPLDASNPAVIWSLVNGSGSAQVSADGRVMALGEGTVEVIATAEDGSLVADTIELTITGTVILVSQIEISSPGGVNSVESGSDLQLSASVLPADASNPVVAWSVINDSGSASVSADGLLTALQAGTIRVVASATDGSGVADTLAISISAAPVLVTGIAILSDGGDTLVAVGNTLQLSASVMPANASNPSVEWSVVNGTGTATICECAILTALSPGTVDVVATALDGSGVSGSLAVTITDPSAVSDKMDDRFIRVYPNPSGGKVYLDTEKVPVERIEVISAGGSVVMELVTDPADPLIELDLTGQQQGIYFIHSHTRNFSSIFRIIIAR